MTTILINILAFSALLSGIFSITSKNPVLWSGKSYLRDKLSNSGDTLKLMVPSNIRKIISGQNNYLGMVTSQKIKETAMGNRGSKSGIIPVKEQRVDGSYFENKSKLRYTLMDYENNYQVKIPSKQIIHKQHYSSINISSLYKANTDKNLKKLILDF